MIVKFVYNGIKVDGKLYKAKYYRNNNGSITIWSKSYFRFPNIDDLYVKENLNYSYADDLTKECITVCNDHKYFKDIEWIVRKNEERKLKRDMMRKLSGL